MPLGSPAEEPFDTSSTCLNVSISSIKYRDPVDRTHRSVAPESSLQRPNYEDILRRVSIVIHQHVATCEDKLARKLFDLSSPQGLFRKSQTAKFTEDKFLAPQYAYTFVRAPVLKSGYVYSMRKVDKTCEKPTLSEVHEFLVSVVVSVFHYPR